MGSEVHRLAAVQIGHKQEQGSKGDQRFQKREGMLVRIVSGFCWACWVVSLMSV